MNFDEFGPFEQAILRAVATVEPSDFHHLCRGLKLLCPAPGDPRGWRTLFGKINQLRDLHILIVHYEGRTDTGSHSLPRLESIQLTEAGAAMVREILDSERGLFAGLNLREVTAEEATAFLQGDQVGGYSEVAVGDILLAGCGHMHPCGDPNCIVPRPAPHKRPPGPPKGGSR